MTDHTWSTTFERFSTGKTTLLGPVTVAVRDWTRPQHGQSRIFEQDFLERLVSERPWTLVVMYLPFSAGLLWWSVRRGTEIGTLAAWYLAGLLVWTLVEYLSHRYVLHHTPRTRRRLAFDYIAHGMHHTYPEDVRRLVFPILVTLPLGLAFLAVFVLALGRLAAPCFAGFVHGYLVYDLAHVAIHRGTLGTPLGRWVRRHHLLHHYATPDRRFGISSPLWDVILRTNR